MNGPATYACVKCQVCYQMGDETTVRLYLKQPWFNHLETKCPKCNTTYWVFELNETSVKYLEDHNQVDGDKVQWDVTHFAPDEVWRQFCQVTGRDYPTERVMSQRQKRHADAEIAFFAYLLEREESCLGLMEQSGG